MASQQQIVILGFMGSGKTTVAHKLAHKLKCRAVDLDHFITQRENRTPQEIIEQDGEPTFRKIETRRLREVLAEEPAGVLAVGGGAWTIAENREMIKERGAVTVWLDAPFDLCWKRIEAGGEGRPLARSRESAQELYQTRRPVYAQAGTRIAVSADDSADETASQVLQTLQDANIT